jgi:hypothetical protein
MLPAGHRGLPGVPLSSQVVLESGEAERQHGMEECEASLSEVGPAVPVMAPSLSGRTGRLL